MRHPWEPISDTACGYDERLTCLSCDHYRYGIGRPYCSRGVTAYFPDAEAGGRRCGAFCYAPGAGDA